MIITNKFLKVIFGKKKLYGNVKNFVMSLVLKDL